MLINLMVHTAGGSYEIPYLESEIGSKLQYKYYKECSGGKYMRELKHAHKYIIFSAIFQIIEDSIVPVIIFLITVGSENPRRSMEVFIS